MEIPDSSCALRACVLMNQMSAFWKRGAALSSCLTWMSDFFGSRATEQMRRNCWFSSNCSLPYIVLKFFPFSKTRVLTTLSCRCTEQPFPVW